MALAHKLMRIAAANRQEGARVGFTHDADRKLVPDPAQRRELRRIKRLHAEGLSPYKISADLAERGVKLSHITIRKIIAGRSPAGTSCRLP
jgi:hypothetical protein